MKILVLCVTLLTAGTMYAGETVEAVGRSRSVVVTKNIVRNSVRPLKRQSKACVDGTCRSRTVTVVR